MSVPHSIVYLNGAFLPLADARVSILDRGFQFADGVYEVIPVYSGIPLRLGSHLERLERSLKAIQVLPPIEQAEFAQIAQELLDRNNVGDCQLYIQVTRGEAPRNHLFPHEPNPTIVMTVSPIEPVPESWLQQGITAITVEDIRWARCDIKSIALLPNVMMRQRAQDAGAHEALLIHAGQAVEGAASNIFAVVEGVAHTPPDGPRLLSGITRNLLLEIGAQQGLPLHSAPITYEDLEKATEIWATSSTRGVLPVTWLDDRPVGEGQPGPLFHRVLDAYRQCIQSL